MQQQVHPDIRAMNDQLRPLLNELQEMGQRKSKMIENRRQLGAQKNENELVKQEMDRLEPDAKVYKLIGPALIPQDQNDAKSIVSNRLDYIMEEVKRVDVTISDMEKKEAEMQRKAQELYQKMQQRQALLVQQQQRLQQQQQEAN